MYSKFENVSFEIENIKNIEKKHSCNDKRNLGYGKVHFEGNGRGNGRWP